MVKVKKGRQLAYRQVPVEEIGKRLFTIGRTLKSARQERTTLDKFSYEINISRTQLIKYEAGGDMLLSSFLKLMYGLDIDTANFFREVENTEK